MKRSSVVYKKNCLDRNSFYIGETKRHLHTRIQEHTNDVGKGVYKSSIFEHSKHRRTLSSLILKYFTASNHVPHLVMMGDGSKEVFRNIVLNILHRD